MKEMNVAFRVSFSFTVEDGGEEEYEKEKAEVLAKLNKEYDEAEIIEEFEL